MYGVSCLYKYSLSLSVGGMQYADIFYTILLMSGYNLGSLFSRL